VTSINARVPRAALASGSGVPIGLLVEVTDTTTASNGRRPDDPVIWKFKTRWNGWDLSKRRLFSNEKDFLRSPPKFRFVKAARSVSKFKFLEGDLRYLPGSLRSRQKTIGVGVNGRE
jgi:hypothetical protein